MLPLLCGLVLVGCKNKGATSASTPTGEAGVFTVDQPAQNLLMISIDTLRRDHISRYDASNRDLTPFLDSWMDRGFVADNHYTCSN